MPTAESLALGDLDGVPAARRLATLLYFEQSVGSAALRDARQPAIDSLLIHSDLFDFLVIADQLEKPTHVK